MEGPSTSELVEAHLGLVDIVVAVERKKLGIRDAHVEEEMRSSATLGLMSAIDRFDSRRRDSFKAYAQLRIRYAIYDGLADSGWFPRRLHRKLAFYRRATEMLHYQSKDPPPSDRTEAVHRLSDQLKDLAAAYVTTYAEEASENPSVPPEAETEAARHQLASRIRRYVEVLPEKQRHVVTQYFYRDINLVEIAKEMDVTTSWTSKLLTAALRNLREMFESQEVGLDELNFDP